MSDQNTDQRVKELAEEYVQTAEDFGLADPADHAKNEASVESGMQQELAAGGTIEELEGEVADAEDAIVTEAINEMLGSDDEDDDEF